MLLIAISQSGYALNAQQVYQKVKDSVFTLYSYDFDSRRIKGRGSAVAVGKDILATNCHVALSGNYLTVNINGKHRVARIFYKNQKQDLCLLEVPKANFHPVKILKSEGVKIGEEVYAIGNPRGTEKTLSRGIISNKHRVKDGSWLQTDAAIYYGSSGGGLFNAQGQLIGITTKMGGRFGFAIPTNWIERVISPHRSKVAVTNNTTSPRKTEQFSSKSFSNLQPKYNYNLATKNLRHIGTYGRDEISLYRNNKECFLSIPGKGNMGQISSLTLWNPNHAKNLVIFSGAMNVKQALRQLYKSIVDKKVHKLSSYKSDNILYLGGHPYRLYGSKSPFERYPYFVARFNKDPMSILQKTTQFSVQFHDPDPKIGNEKMTYQMDGFEQALQTYKKQCQTSTPGVAK